ncbi:right-handed parallel beta-helix repeat-containing protein [Streptomyces fructofermentans]|uniref:Right handed beta helix domain-containing protein n=1 Tax=Streptomyces fructofermentans TaxID=152141 RepID=A0A918NVR6_9ACTN|nr:right-handed parallel beta-helix repeat-containing protein [Streptomyces fructofermentans]GGX99706.1 hypothetical protein GCM10010515_77200 [Streptomyces fructofermentans]
MPLYTFGGNPAAVLTTDTGDVVPNYPIIIRVAGSGAEVTALYEEDGTTPIGLLRSNAIGSDSPGAIRTFKADDVSAIEYEYLGPSGDPVRWYETSREASTAALLGLESKFNVAGGTITGDVDIEGTLDVEEILVNGLPISGLGQAGIYLPQTYGAVGNGIADDAPAIQAALDAAFTAGGGWVIVPAGTYKVATLPLRGRHGVRLTLADGATIARGANGTMFLNGTAVQAYGGYTGHGNMIIEGGMWDAKASSYPTSAMVLSLGHAQNITVRNTVLKDTCGYHAIEMNAIKTGRIINVSALGYLDPDGTRTFSEAFQFDLAKGSSYFGGFGPYDDTPCVDVLVQGCTVGPSGTPGTTSWPRGVGSHSASPSKPHSGITVRDLYCEDLTQFAVGGYTWQDVVVSGLTLKNCGAGVRMRTLDSSSASHRTPAGAGSPSIAGSQPLRNIVVDDVVMYGGGTYDAAVRIEGEDTGYVEGVTIDNIICRDVGSQALRLVDVEDYTVDHVVARGCGATGVSTLGTRRGRIRAHINGAVGAGIAVDSRSTPAASATDVTLEGCSVTGTSANGIHIWDGNGVIVDDCDTYALTGYGIQVSTNTANPTFRNCRSRDTTLAGLNITNTVTGVKRYGNSVGSVADASTTPTDTSPFDSGFGALEDAMRPAGRYETTSRMRAGATTTAMVSGVLYLVPIWLPKGAVISNISFMNGATAAGTPTNYWFSLHNSARVALARTADQTTTAWAANTVKTLAIAQTTAGTASSYTTTYSGLHYLGVMIKATSLPNLVGEGSMSTGPGASPGFGDTTTGMSTPPTVTAGAFTAAAFGGNVGLLAYGYAA